MVWKVDKISGKVRDSGQQDLDKWGVLSSSPPKLYSLQSFFQYLRLQTPFFAQIQLGVEHWWQSLCGVCLCKCQFHWKEQVSVCARLWTCELGEVPIHYSESRKTPISLRSLFNSGFWFCWTCAEIASSFATQTDRQAARPLDLPPLQAFSSFLQTDFIWGCHACCRTWISRVLVVLHRRCVSRCTRAQRGSATPTWTSSTSTSRRGASRCSTSITAAAPATARPTATARGPSQCPRYPWSRFTFLC